MILVFDAVSHRLFIEEDDYQPQAYELLTKIDEVLK